MAVFFLLLFFVFVVVSDAGLVCDEDAKKQKKLNFLCRVACIYIRYHVTLKIAQIFSLRFFSLTLCVVDIAFNDVSFFLNFFSQLAGRGEAPVDVDVECLVICLFCVAIPQKQS